MHHCMTSSLVLCCLVLSLLATQLSCCAARSAEVAALLAFKSQLDASSTESLSTWAPTEASSPCRWRRVTCDRQGSVVALRLQELKLWGPLSPELTQLRHLQHLNMSANQLSGPITPLFSRLHFLTHLDLHQNNLTGPIPSSLSLCTNLLLLDLSRNPLSGTIPPALSSLHSLQIIQLHHIPLLTGPLPVFLFMHLPNLTHLCLGTNNLTGTIPSQISLLSKLQHLAIYENPAIRGPIPTHIGRLPALRSLKLFSLNLSGSSIPAELGNLTSLQSLYLFNAELGGMIPKELGNLSNLEVLDLQLNHLTGTIPSSLGKLRNLTELNLFSNLLQGPLPPQLGNLSSLTSLYLQSNRLSHSIPPEIGNLHNLHTLSIYFNSLSGRIPAELGQLANLQYFYAFANSFHGELPPQLGNLTRLIDLGLGGNRFAGSSIPSELGAMKSLQNLELNDVQVNGEIPSSLGNLTELTYLRLSSNMLHGRLPTSLAKCSKLKMLKLETNDLEGEIPEEYFTLLTQLHTLSLYRNKLRGEIPDKVARLTNLAVLNLGLNNFSGRMPDEVMPGMRNLRVLSVGGNKLEGELPSWVWELEELKMLDVSNNGFTGAISPRIKQLGGFKLSSSRENSSEEVGEANTLWVDDVAVIFKGAERWYFTLSLTLMTSLDLSFNKFQGVLPAEIGELTALFNLNLSHNAFHGPIPQSFGDLRQLESLDLSSNLLCAEIPQELTHVNTLAYFNVSYNLLSGPIPTDGQFSFDNRSYLGNTYLCGESLARKCDGYSENLKTCNGSSPLHEHNPKRRGTTRIYIICGASVVVLIIVCFVALMLWLSRHGDAKELYICDNNLSNVRHELASLVQQGCNINNQIGSGGSSIVHKLTLSNGKLVAVKKLNLELNKEDAKIIFYRESKILGHVKHRNVIKLLGIYSSPKIHHFACILDFICNGTLDDHLHRINETRSPLNWDQRLNVVIGIAQGLCYLHNDSGFGQIIHLDLKPSNILMDEDLQPHISDFGTSRMMGRWNETSTASSHFIGTVGYAAPECGNSCTISDKADVYSFGIVLLELVTGRRPISNESHTFETFEEADLRSWVLKSLNMEQQILDSYIQGPSMMSSFAHKQALDIIQIAFLCTLQQPIRRPSMKQALAMILDCNNMNKDTCHKDYY